MPESSLYEAINKIRVDAFLEDERKRRSTFSGAIAALLEQLPPSRLTRDEVAVLVEKYEIRRAAAKIVRELFPERK